MNIIRKNLLSFFLLSILVISPSLCFAQSKTLNLHFPDEGNEKEITLRYSIHGILNYLYEPYIKNCKTTGKNLTLIIPDSITTFIMSIDSKPSYNWGIEDIDYSLERGLDTNQVHRLSSLDFVKERKDLFITGPTGTGKSYLASAIGYHACQMYASTAKLMGQLKLAKLKGTLLSELKGI